MKSLKTNWYKNAVVYQIYPFSYMDSNNDGMGDIQGIISKLDYIKDLGITAIWFSPLYDSPNYDYGYDIKDYLSIQPKFGTMDDFKELIKECHKRDIKVIMDIAVNHSSIEHEWFKKAISSKDSPYRDYYIIRKGIKKGNRILPPNNWKSSFTGSAWEKLPGSEDEFYLHTFLKEQADLNWESEALRNEIINIFNTLFSMGVDGFRMDVFNIFSKIQTMPNSNELLQTGRKYYIDGPRMHEFLKELNEKAFSKYDSFIVGESMMPHEEDKIQYVKEDSNEIDAIFDFGFYQSDCHMIAYLKKKFNLRTFKKALLEPEIRNIKNNGWSTLVIENHDGPRCISRYGIDTANYRVEAARMIPIMLYLQFGTPFVYQGQEIGMTSSKFESIDEMMDPVSHFVYNLIKFIPKKLRLKMVNDGARDHARTPMQWDSSINSGFTKGTPWQSLNPNFDTINVENDLNSEKSIYKMYQKVLEFKKNSEVAIYGSITEYDHKNKYIFSYTREYNNDNLFVVTNFSNKERSYVIPEELLKYDFKEELNSYDDVRYSDGKLYLHPYQAICFSFRK